MSTIDTITGSSTTTSDLYAQMLEDAKEKAAAAKAAAEAAAAQDTSTPATSVATTPDITDTVTLSPASVAAAATATASAEPITTATPSVDASSSAVTTTAASASTSASASTTTSTSSATYTNSYGDTVDTATGIILVAAHGDGHKGMADATLKKTSESANADTTAKQETQPDATKATDDSISLDPLQLHLQKAYKAE